MATLVLGALGAGIAAVASGGNPAAIQLGFNIGAVVGGLLFSHNVQQIGKLNDLHVTGSSYGTLIPSVYGAVRIGSNVIWARPLVEHHSGGKGSGIETFTYTCSFAVSVCRGPVPGVRRIWADDILVYDSAAATPTKYNIHPPYLGDEEQLPDALIQAFEGAANTPAYRGQCYVVFEDLPLTDWGNRIPSLSFEMETDVFQPTRVCDVLTDFALQCGMVEGVDFDFGAMYDEVDGISTNQRSPAYSQGEQLLQVFAGDVAEIDGMLVAVRRGEPSVGHLTVADMGAHDWQSSDADPPSTISTVRKSDLSLPFKYDVTYSSSDATYTIGLQSAIRHSRQAIQDSKTLPTSITMSDQAASKVAYRLLDTEWLERVVATISVGVKWLLLAPASPFTVDVNGHAIRHRVTSMDITAMGAIVLTLVVDNSITDGLGLQIGGYMNEVAVSGAVKSGTSGGLVATPSTLFDAYSGPEFSDADGLSPGFYVAASRASTIYWSQNGADWVRGPAVSTPADFGVTTSALAATVGVALDHGTVESAAAVDLPTGVNAALVGQEIVSYQDVAPGADSNAYTLSTLTRGLRGSPTTGHAAGDRFWHLNSAIARVSVPVSLIGTVVHVKVLTSGQAISDVGSKDVTIHANRFPYVTPSELAVYMTNGDPDGPTFLFNDGVLITSEG